MSLITILVLGALALSATALPKKGRFLDGLPRLVPHQARIFASGDPSNGFGGTLISKNWVVTAASRTYLINTGDLYVYEGETSVNGVSPARHISLVMKKVEHPQFVPTLPSAHDLALLQLASPALLSSFIYPAILPTRADVSNDFVGLEAIISGWGNNALEGETQNFLSLGYATVIDNNECQTYFQGFTTILDTHICAKGKSTCQGDEGGPLVYNLGIGTFKLIGVNSFHSSLGCVADAAAGFTRISLYLDWISETTSIAIED